MRCAAQRFPQAVVRCNTPRSVPLRSAWRGAVLGGNRCNSKRTFDAGRKLQQTTCNRHHAADNIQHEASGGQHTRKANKRRQRAADNMQRKRRGRREAADSVQQTPCGIRHAAHNVQHRRAADNVQRTTCGRQRAAGIMECITRTRQNGRDELHRCIKTTCSRQRATKNVQRTSCNRPYVADNMPWPADGAHKTARSGNAYTFPLRLSTQPTAAACARKVKRLTG